MSNKHGRYNRVEKLRLSEKYTATPEIYTKKQVKTNGGKMTQDFNQILKDEYKRWEDFPSKGTAESFLYNEGYRQAGESSVWYRTGQPAYVYEYINDIITFNDNGSEKNRRRITISWRVGFGDHVTENKCLSNRFRG